MPHSCDQMSRMRHYCPSPSPTLSTCTTTLRMNNPASPPLKILLAPRPLAPHSEMPIPGAVLPTCWNPSSLLLEARFQSGSRGPAEPSLLVCPQFTLTTLLLSAISRPATSLCSTTLCLTIGSKQCLPQPTKSLPSGETCASFIASKPSLNLV